MSNLDVGRTNPGVDLGQTIRGFAAGQKLFGRYTLKHVVGRGGMGVVWLARDDHLEVDVALKFLPELIALDKGAIADMKRETRRSRELAHHNIVKVHQFELEAEVAAISMEYVDGDTLANLKAERPGGCFNHNEIAAWLVEVADALEYAHYEAKMVHRDLKPANIMLDSRGRVRITDFGIASGIADSVSQLSVQHGASGTPPYMSPQQAAGSTPHPVDDVYSLGATIYDLLTGKPPFYSGNIHHQVENIVPPPMAVRRAELGNSGEPIPDVWEKTIAACLAKDPAKRPQSAGQIVYQLGLTPDYTRRARTPIRTSGTPATAQQASRRELFVGSAIIALLIAAAIWWFGWKPKPTGTAHGGLAIDSQPPGATVLVNGEDKGKTPLSINGIPTGKSQVQVALPGYYPDEFKVQIDEDRIANVGTLKLQPAVGSLKIQSEPAGKHFAVTLKQRDAGGEDVKKMEGVAPALLDKLPTGTYEVVVSEAGWPEQRRTLRVEADKTATWNAIFASGSVRLDSTPAGAAVWAAGNELGKTPVRFDAQPGDAEYQLRLPGFAPTTVRVRVEAKQEAHQSVTLRPRIYTSPDRVVEGYIKAHPIDPQKPDLSVLANAVQLAAASSNRAETLPQHWNQFIQTAGAFTNGSFNKDTLTPASAGAAFTAVLQLGSVPSDQRKTLVPIIQKIATELPTDSLINFAESSFTGLQDVDRSAANDLQRSALTRVASNPDMLVRDGSPVSANKLIDQIPSDDRGGFLKTFIAKAASISPAKKRGEALLKLPSSVYITDPQRTREYHSAVLAAARSGAYDSFDILRRAGSAAADGENEIAARFADTLKDKSQYYKDNFAKELNGGKLALPLLAARRAVADGKFANALDELRRAPRNATFFSQDAEKLAAEFRRRGDLATAIEVIRRSDSPASDYHTLLNDLRNDGASDQAGLLMTALMKSTRSPAANALSRFELATSKWDQGNDDEARKLLTDIPAADMLKLPDAVLPLLGKLSMPKAATPIWDKVYAEMQKNLQEHPGQSYTLSPFVTLYASAMALKWEDKLHSLDDLASSHASLIDDYQADQIVEAALLANQPGVTSRWRGRLNPQKSTAVQTAAQKFVGRGGDAEADALLASLDSDKLRAQFWNGVVQNLLPLVKSATLDRRWVLPDSKLSSPNWVGKAGGSISAEQAFSLATGIQDLQGDANTPNAFAREAAGCAAQSGQDGKVREILDQLAGRGDAANFDIACQRVAAAWAHAGRFSDLDGILSKIKTPTGRFNALTALVEDETISLPAEKIRDFLATAEGLVPSVKQFGNWWATPSTANSLAQAYAYVAKLTNVRLHDVELAKRRAQKARHSAAGAPANEHFWSCGRVAVYLAAGNLFDEARECARESSHVNGTASVVPAQVGNFWAAIAQWQIRAGDRTGAEETLRMGEESIRAAAKRFRDPSSFVKNGLNGLGKDHQELIATWLKQAETETANKSPMPLEQARTAVAEYLNEDGSSDSLVNYSSGQSIGEYDHLLNAFFDGFRGILKFAPLEEVTNCVDHLRIVENLPPEKLIEARWQRARAARLAGERFRQDDRTGEAKAWIDTLPSNLERAFAWLGVAEGPPPQGF